MAEQSIERFISSCMKECVEDNVSALAENAGEAGRRAVKLLKQGAHRCLQEGLEGRC